MTNIVHHEDYSWITIRKVLDFYGYKTHRNKPKAFKEILDVLEYMINNKMIEVKQDLDSLSYDTGIEIKIISENFDSTEKFGKLTSSQFDTIMMADSSLNRENILVAFLYINSYIGVAKDRMVDLNMKMPRTIQRHFIEALNICQKNYLCQKTLLTNV